MDALARHPLSDKEFVTGSHDRTIFVWDTQSFKAKARFKGHELGVWSICYDNTGKRLMTSSPDKTARIWDIKTGKVT